MYTICSGRGIADSLAFVIVAETARRSRIRGGGLVMPSLLDTILRDATQYFMFIFSAHLLSLIFLFVTPVGGTRYA